MSVTLTWAKAESPGEAGTSRHQHCWARERMGWTEGENVGENSFTSPLVASFPSHVARCLFKPKFYKATGLWVNKVRLGKGFGENPEEASVWLLLGRALAPWCLQWERNDAAEATTPASIAGGVVCSQIVPGCVFLFSMWASHFYYRLFFGHTYIKKWLNLI